MKPLQEAIDQVLEAQKQTQKPLAIVLAGHNGSGKSTMWSRSLSGQLQIPLINADRMMLSILPEPNSQGAIADWAQNLRDTDERWMKVAQESVKGFVSHAMAAQVPFAMETVFSDWRPQPDGSFASKIDRIRDMQKAGYFVLLVFVGLSNADLSVLRVQTRVANNGHDVPYDKLIARFGRTQTAIKEATMVADASILTDNSRTAKQAFSVCRVQLREEELFDVRKQSATVPPAILQWLDIVSPIGQG